MPWTRCARNLRQKCKQMPRGSGCLGSIFWHCNPRHLTKLNRHYSTNHSTTESYFLTTPIFYVNAVPHIGHLHTAVLADAVARWQRIRGQSVIFSTGTDEHGLKVQQSAQRKGQAPLDHCDEISKEFQRLFDHTNISYTDYVRTTEERHKEAVHTFWERLKERDFIYRGRYEGWYSTSDEAFLKDDEVSETIDENGKKIKVSTESGQPVEWMKEENYMFRLSEFAEQLEHWLDTGVIQPTNFEPMVWAWLRAGLPDLSVSRQSDRIEWGIPVPGDQTQTIYVWLDALVNYLTVAGYPTSGYKWPTHCHVIGKDILRFHAVYWPAFLMAAGLKPPKKILCHSHWTVDGLKMSKSRGNVVDPYAAAERYTVDGLRYFLLREGVPHSDGNFTHRRVVECLNSELVNTLANLLSRCTSSAVNPQQIVPTIDQDLFTQRASPEELAMFDRLKDLPDLVDQHYCDFNIYRGLELIIAQLHDTNAFVQHQKPWQLSKEETQTAWLNTVLAVAMESLRVTGILLQPVVPRLSGRILDRISVQDNYRNFNSAKTLSTPSLKGLPLGNLEGPLIQRIKI